MRNKFLLFAVVLLLLCSCADVIAETTSLEPGKEGETIAKKPIVEKLSGYFAKNTVKFDDNYDFKHLVVTNPKDFDKYFGIAKTMNNQVDKVNFAENSVIAIITRPANISRKIDLIYSELKADRLLIRYHIREGSKNTYAATGLYLATIPRDVAQVKFQSRYNVGIVDVK